MPDPVTTEILVDNRKTMMQTREETPKKRKQSKKKTLKVSIQMEKTKRKTEAKKRKKMSPLDRNRAGDLSVYNLDNYSRT